MSLAPGTKLGPYEIQSPLGAGGMGEVYRARDTRLARIVAIKVLPSHLCLDPERKQRFEREARAISSLNHPNICTLYDVGSQDGIEYLVMEYLEGETLASRLMRGALPLDRALTHGIEVSDALDAAHRRGIIHRDLKPSNIFLTAHGEAKVLDFGLVKLEEEVIPEMTTVANPATLTSPGTTVGTVAYMSPEQARGEDLDIRTDIFSFGTVLYETLTGKMAFPGKTSAIVFKAILDETPAAITRVNPILPPKLDEILSKALEKDRDLRYQSTADLRTDLKRLKRDVESGRVAVRPLSSGEKLFSKQSQILKTLAASLLVIALATTLTWWISRLSTTKNQLPAMTITPLTSYPGNLLLPRFSPDGSQIAFLWDRGEAKGVDAYVKLIGESSPLRLTSSPADIYGLTWSPDGHRLALLRAGETAGVFSVSALGGAERRFAQVRFPTYGNFGLDWAPNGKWIAVVDKDIASEAGSIFLLSAETAERRRLTTPAIPFSDSLPVFSPDSKLVAFVRGHSGPLNGDVFVVPVDGGEAKKVTSLNALILGIDWSADGKEIVVAAFREGGNSGLWRIGFNGGRPESVGQLGSASLAWPTMSRQGNRLAYVQEVHNSNIWQFQLASPRRLNGRPVKLISSTRTESGAQYSPDGKRIVFVSTRSGSAQIWTCANDGSNQAQMTFLKATDVGTPHWSPDGSKVVFDSTASGNDGVYLIMADGGAPQPLVVDSFANYQASFSRDGQWVYFVSDRSGTEEIWKIAVTGGQPVKVSSYGARMPLEGIDGKFLYHVKLALEGTPSTAFGLWRLPLAGGEDIQVLHERLYEGEIGRDFFWTVTAAGIYFVDNITPRPNLKLFDPATRHTTTVAELDNPPDCCNPALSVSSNGRSLLYSQVDNSTRDIMLVENFH